MSFRRTRNIVVVLFSVARLALLLAGCSFSNNDEDQQSRNDQARDETAKAVEKAKPYVQEAGRELKDAANAVSQEARAAVQGAKEGWHHGEPPVNLNTATEADLLTLPGIGHQEARQIITRRPFRDRHELVSKGIVTEDEYAKLRDAITTK